MIRRAVLAAALTAALGASVVAAQTHPAVRQARVLYDSLNFDSVIVVGRAALAQRGLSRQDRIALQELLGFAYATIDSTSGAVSAFAELIRLDPDREPDPLIVSPRITSRYAFALGQVLVVRRMRADSARFVAGEGAAAYRFQVSRAAQVRTRVVGAGTDVRLDSGAVVGEGMATWNGLGSSGAPAPPGRYQLIVEAQAGRESFSAATSFTVAAAPLDTLPHLTALPGYDEQPEFEQPRRDLRPLATAASYLGIGAAAALALRNNALGAKIGGLAAVGAVGIGSALVVSLRPPPPRPVPAAALYNSLLRDMLARRNQEIAAGNAVRRLKVVLTVMPALEAVP